MNRRAAAILLGTVFVLALAAILWRRGSTDAGSDALGTPDRPEVPGALVAVDLYFPNASGRLVAEPREVAYGSTSPERLGAILDELFTGPATEGSFPPLPESVAVGSIHVSDTGVAYVDLTSTEHAVPPVAGTRDELLTVYSIVNSLLANTPEIRSIVLLWNGQQLESFAGHIDTTRPLVANPNL